MKKTIICMALAASAMSGSSLAHQDKPANPFIDLNTDIVDIYHDYIQASYNVNESQNGFSVKASKSLNRFMFVDLGLNYIDPKEDVIANSYGKSIEVGFGLNYPLPIPVDVMVADLYVRGFGHYLDSGNYSYKNVNIDDINRSLISSNSYGAVAGLKSNFGSDSLYLNLYGGFEVNSFTDKVDFKDKDNKAINDIDDETLPIYGAELEFLIGKKTSLIFGGEHRLDENALKTSLRYSF